MPAERPSLTLEMLIRTLGKIADNVMITDKDGIIQYVNPAFEKTTGYKEKEILGKTPRVLKSGKQDSRYYKKLWTTILNGKSFRDTIINKNKKGELFYADQTITPIKNKDEITHFISVWKDVTDFMRAREQLHTLKDSLEFEKYKLEQILNFDESISTINSLHKLIDFVIQKACDILEVERCSIMLFDKDSGELLIKGARGLKKEIIERSRLKINEPIAGVVAQERRPLLVTDIEKDKRFGRKNRSSCRTKSFMSAPIILDQRLLGVLNVTDKISPRDTEFNDMDLKIVLAIVRQAAVAIENSHMYRKLKYLTITDPLTNLFNYRHFIRSLDHEINRVKRFGGRLCLLMMDVDDFKAYNDAYGHLEGDVLLKEVGNILTHHLRIVDIVCRYAGDEFVVILPETEKENARVVAKKILHFIGGIKLKRKVTVSIGIAQCTPKMDRYDLILRTDQALHQAKKKGKNQLSSL